MSDNSAFISYRRSTGYPWARLIWDELQERSVNVFLDLETMRQAGRFDQRILNQIAARPYFLVVLTEGTLDRCSSPDDWVRREIEYAIEADRIVVPLFIAPFEPSLFPPDLPTDIADVLSNSNGVTFYNQFIREAFDQLVVLMAPAVRSTVELTDDDAEFERSAVGRVRAEPLPAPVIPPETPPETEASAPVDESALDGDNAPPLDESHIVGESVGEEAVVHPDARPAREPDPPPSASVPTDDGDDGREAVGAPVTPGRRGTGNDPDPRRRWALVAAAAAVVVIGVVGLVIAGGGGGDDRDDPDAGATSVASRPVGGGGADGGDGGNVVDIEGAVGYSISTAGGNAFVTVDGPVVSETGGHRLVMTSAGRLELRTGDDVVWTPTYFSPPVPGAVAILQESDGNFVVYPSAEPAADDPVLWAIGEQPGTDVELRVFDDDGRGVVAVFQQGREIWRRSGSPPDAAGGTTRDTDPVAGTIDTTGTTDSTTTTEEQMPTTTEPPFATASDLGGRSFVAAAVEGRTLVDGTDLTVSFDGDRISYDGGCNTAQSRYDLDAGVLTLIGPAVSTLIACDPATSEQDRWFSNVLGDDPTLTLIDGDLVLTTDDVTIEFR